MFGRVPGPAARRPSGCWWTRTRVRPPRRGTPPRPGGRMWTHACGGHTARCSQRWQVQAVQCSQGKPRPCIPWHCCRRAVRREPTPRFNNTAAPERHLVDGARRICVELFEKAFHVFNGGGARSADRHDVPGQCERRRPRGWHGRWRTFHFACGSLAAGNAMAQAQARRAMQTHQRS